jgi:serine/threonine protein kinase
MATSSRNPLIAGRYQIQATAGSGGLGKVYRCLDLKSHVQVAVKVLRTDVAAHAEALGQQMQEAQTLSTLVHPNIVRILDFGVDEEMFYLVMELIFGTSLDCQLAKGPLKMDEWTLVARESLRGLAAAHAEGVLHLDLKPENLMLAGGAEGPFQVKLIDFGLARFERLMQTPDEPSAEIQGSLYYVPPEILRSEQPVPQSDLYSLGSTLFEAATGKVLFSDQADLTGILKAHLFETPPSIETRCPGFPSALDAWVRNLLSKLPSVRPATAAVALEGLEKALLEGK